MSTRILVVDDDAHLREVVRYALTREGFEVEEAGDGRAALERLRRDAFDLVVLDVLMPELDGLETCRQLRSFSQVPVVFLSSRAEEIDTILGLELGGDDYVAKPFSPRELTSRVKAVLRRTKPVSDDPVLTCAGVRLDPVAHRVWAAGSELALTATEFRILATLMGHPGRVYSREQLVEHAYPDVRFVAARTLDSHVRRIRAKLREHGVEVITTVHGVGYRMGA